MHQQLPPREKIFNIPGVIVGLLLVFTAIHIVRVYLLTPEEDARLLATFAFVPGRFTYAFDPGDVLTALSRQPVENAAVGRFFLGSGSLQPWTILTYAFLHGSWEHLGLNALWLVAFGVPVARRFGSWRFLAFMAITAIAGAGTYCLFHRFDLVPVIGASAAISGTMAAAIRFVFVPGAPLGASFGFGALSDERAYLQRPLPLVKVFTDQRALAFLVIWFAANFLFGIVAVPLGITTGAIAWEAHIGGFVSGLVLFPLFDPRREYPDETFLDSQSEWRDPYAPQ